MTRPHETTVRVRYQETDNMHIVYYANYFVWFEVARTEYFRSIGLEYKKVEESGYYLPVISASCDYKYPARYDDLVRIETWITDIKNSSLKFMYKMFVGEKLIASGSTLHAFVNNHGKPVRVPANIRGLLSTA